MDKALDDQIKAKIEQANKEVKEIIETLKAGDVDISEFLEDEEDGLIDGVLAAGVRRPGLVGSSGAG